VKYAEIAFSFLCIYLKNHLLLLGVRDVSQHDKGSSSGSICGSVACFVRETEGAIATAGECNCCERTALAVLAAAAAATAAAV